MFSISTKIKSEKNNIIITLQNKTRNHRQKKKVDFPNHNHAIKIYPLGCYAYRHRSNPIQPHQILYVPRAYHLH